MQLSSERAVRHALRPILSGTPRESALFDDVFQEFFFPRVDPQELSSDADAPSDSVSASGRGDAAAKRRRSPSEIEIEDSPVAGEGVGEPNETTDDTLDGPALFALASYSPLAAKGPADAPSLSRADAEWRAAARMLVRHLHVGLSRRWIPARRGRRFDQRRTLRARLQTGGEPLESRWLVRPRRTPRLTPGRSVTPAPSRPAVQEA